MAETLLIAGAGIAGLNAAMALARADRTVIVIDRDPPPPDLDAEAAFHEWERKGVTQLRHSHVFLGRLIKLIRTHHPKLWDNLLVSGAREFKFADALPHHMQKDYAYKPGDEDMSFLFSRRTTLELVMRRYAETLPGVRFLTGTGIRGVITQPQNGGTVVTGLVVSNEAGEQTLNGDIIVDATGRDTQFPDWLAAQGVKADAPSDPAGILYFTRHYKLREGQDEPSRDGTPGAGDLGYIKYGVFAADNRHFSLTLAVPEIETALRMAIMKPETFDAICAAIPGAGRWTNAQRAEPVSKVFAMGNLKSVWRRYAGNGKPALSGFFAIGDAALRTNPLYGRGCSIGAIQSYLLAGVLDDVQDRTARLASLEQRSHDELRAFFDVMVKQDAQAIRRAANEQREGYKPSLKSRIVTSLLADAIGPASRSNLDLMRDMMRPFHMLEHPSLWLKRGRNRWAILKAWMTPRRFKAHLYEPKHGPARREMFDLLSLPSS